jgi:hypothetical protein
MHLRLANDLGSSAPSQATLLNDPTLATTARRHRSASSRRTRPPKESALAACSGLPAAELTYPFGDATTVFKVAGKVFAVVSLDDSTG